MSDTARCLRTELGGEGRRAAGDRGGKNGSQGVLCSRRSNQRERTQVRMEDEDATFKALPGRTHPGAEDARVGSGLVMGMVEGVLHRLGIDQPAEQQEAAGKPDREEFLESSIHRALNSYRCDGSPLSGLCQVVTLPPPSVGAPIWVFD